MNINEINALNEILILSNCDKILLSEDINVTKSSDEEIKGSLDEYIQIIKTFSELVFNMSLKPIKIQEKEENKLYEIYSGLSFSENIDKDTEKTHKIFLNYLYLVYIIHSC